MLFAALNIIYPVIMMLSTVGFMFGIGGALIVAAVTFLFIVIKQKYYNY